MPCLNALSQCPVFSSRLLPQPRLQHCHEKSVGAVASGKQPQHAVLRLRTIVTANHILPDIAYFRDFQLRRLGQDAFDLRLALAVQERAGDIDDAPARRQVPEPVQGASITTRSNLPR